LKQAFEAVRVQAMAGAADAGSSTGAAQGSAPSPLLQAWEEVANSTMGTVDALRSGYESTLRSGFAAFLNGTNELRYQLQDGNFVIDQVRGTVMCWRGREMHKAAETTHCYLLSKGAPSRWTTTGCSESLVDVCRRRQCMAW